MTVIYDKKRIGARIRDIRLANDFSQNNVANLFKYSRTAIHYWEIGKTLPLEQILRYIDYFGVSADAFFTYSDEEWKNYIILVS